MSSERLDLINHVIALLEEEDTSTLHELLSEQRSSDIAEIVEYLGNEDRNVIIHLLDRTIAAEVLEKVDEATRNALYDLLEDEELRDLINEMDFDDAADILGELPEEDLQELLDRLEPEDSEKIKQLMTYSEDSAGGIMDPVLISVNENCTVTEAIQEIRSHYIDEDFFAIYVTKEDGTFLGDVRLRSLLVSPGNTLISKLIEEDTISVKVDADQEEVRNLFSKYELIVVPVLDENNILVGRITADRIIEVAEDEATEDIYTMAGTNVNEMERRSIFHAARIRLTWLLPCLMGTSITAFAMMMFKNFFMHHKIFHLFGVAASFVPMITAMSGNAGLQTSAVVVCGLATGHLASGKLKQVFFKEVRVAALIAISCGILGGLICTFLPSVIKTTPETVDFTLSFQQHAKMVSAFAIAMFSAIMVATTLGLILPFVFKKVGIDPAISSGPLVTTANDSISAVIYLSLTITLLLYL